MKPFNPTFALLQRLSLIEFAALLLASSACIFAIAWVNWIAPARDDAQAGLFLLQDSQRALKLAESAPRPSPAPPPAPAHAADHRTTTASRAVLDAWLEQLATCEAPAAEAVDFLDSETGIEIRRIDLPAPQLLPETVAIGRPVHRQTATLWLTSTYEHLQSAITRLETRQPNLQWTLTQVDSRRHPRAEVHLNFRAYCLRTPS